MLVGVAAAAIGEALAIIVGITAGYVGGVTDEILSTITNIFLVIPVLPLEIVLSGYLTNSGWLGITLIIALTSWPWGARTLRSRALVRGPTLPLDAELRVDDFVNPQVYKREAKTDEGQAQARRRVPPPSITEKGVGVLGKEKDAAPAPALDTPYPQEGEPRLYDDREQHLEK